MLIVKGGLFFPAMKQELVTKPGVPKRRRREAEQSAVSVPSIIVELRTRVAPPMVRADLSKLDKGEVVR